jgi:hypothetical protein
MEQQQAYMLYASGWYDGPLSGLALWQNEIVAFSLYKEYHEVDCAPGVDEPDSDDDYCPNGFIYNGRQSFFRSFTLHWRDPRRIHMELVNHFAWARLVHCHHSRLGTPCQPGADPNVVTQWIRQRLLLDQQFEPDGPVIDKTYLTVKFNAGLLREQMPKHIQEQLSCAEQEFESSWAAYCNQS